MRAVVVAIVLIGCDAPSRPPHDFDVPVVPPSEPTFVAYSKVAELPPLCVPKIGSGERSLGERRYVVDLAAGEGLHPLVLGYHGWGGDPDQLEGTTLLAKRGVERGFTVVRPFGAYKTFDGGACCGTAQDKHVDDVGFARDVVAELVRDACVDPSRVYATGFSNGGFMAHRLGCEAADVFAAVASVAGPLGVSCKPSRPISVMQVHGLIDGIVPFAGDSSKGWRSVSWTMDAWTKIDGCAEGASEELFARGSARCVRNTSCRDSVEVVLCRDDQAAHTWPGGPKSTGWGGSQDLDATAQILDFFSRHVR
ncbi:MAG: alpha/beta hydrolase family esterase [Polyangiales bacterium]